MFSTLSILGIFLATQVAKKYIAPKYGATGVHIFAFVVAFIIISVKGLASTYPPLGAMLMTAGQWLVASLALYKIIVKPITDNLNFQIPIISN